MVSIWFHHFLHSFVIKQTFLSAKCGGLQSYFRYNNQCIICASVRKFSRCIFHLFESLENTYLCVTPWKIIKEAWLSGRVLTSGAEDPRIKICTGPKISCYVCCAFGQGT